MRRIRTVFVIVFLFQALLSACGAAGGAAAGNSAPKAIESYLQALVIQDRTKLTTLSCAAWEEQAKLEVDSFQAVKASLDGLTCKETGKDGDASLVICDGKIVATYNNENQEIPLNARTYKAVQEGGEWRMCGYK